jgi:PAS domain S-box-containing protein
MSDLGPPFDDVGRLQALFAWAERTAQTGSWVYVPATRVVLWSDNLYRIFGVEPGAFELSIESIAARVHPDDRPRIDAAVRKMGDSVGPAAIEYRITRPDGSRRHLRATIAAVEEREHRPNHILGLVEDLTDRRHAEREIAAHVAVAEALVAWDTLERGAHGLLARLADALDCVEGVFWVPRDDVLVPRVIWHEHDVVPRFETAAGARPLRRPIGLPGRAWEARAPLSWARGDAVTADPAAGVPHSTGLRGAIAIPALMGGEVLAVVELKADTEVTISERLMRSLYGIAHELGHFLSRRGGELAAPLLTRREIEVLQLAAGGLSAPRIAEELTVGVSTVRTHMENVYVKLEASDRSSAVATALRLGLID